MAIGTRIPTASLMTDYVRSQLHETQSNVKKRDQTIPKTKRKWNACTLNFNLIIFFSLLKIEMHTTKNRLKMCSVYAADELLVCSVFTRWMHNMIANFPWNSLGWIIDCVRLRECNFVVSMEKSLAWLFCLTYYAHSSKIINTAN